MMFRHLLVAAISCMILGGSAAAAQTQPDSTKPAATTAEPTGKTTPELMDQFNFWAVGLQGGLATGSGLSVRTTMMNRFAFEATGFVWSTGNIWWNLGLEAQYLLDQAFDHRFYALGGVGYYFHANDLKDNTLSAPFRIGVGIGYEWFFSPKACLAAEVPITFFPNDGGKMTILPLPQLQLMFYFR